MHKEFSPDDLFDPAADRRPGDVADFAMREDPGAEPDPDDLDDSLTEAGGPDLSRVTWPEDARAPDYAWLKDMAEPESFELTADVLEGVVQAGRFDPFRDRGLVAFALRGARLAEGHEAVLQRAIRIETARPDHRRFRCVLGFWHVQTGRVTAFTGSTVPCRLAIAGFAAGGDRSNMLPTGLYTTYVWRHKRLRPALRMSTGNASDAALEAGAQVTVLRSRNDTTLDTTDIFDRGDPPLDNVHCSFFLNEDARLGAAFSSWGCLTVRGRKDPSDQWKTYQEVLSDYGTRNRLDLLVVTGKEAALHAGRAVGAAQLVALRPGSKGGEVSRLQQALGIGDSDFFGPVTADRFTGFQRAFNERNGRGRVADGVLTPSRATEMGLGVFLTS